MFSARSDSGVLGAGSCFSRIVMPKVRVRSRNRENSDASGTFEKMDASICSAWRKPFFRPFSRRAVNEAARFVTTFVVVLVVAMVPPFQKGGPSKENEGTGRGDWI